MADIEALPEVVADGTSVVAPQDVPQAQAEAVPNGANVIDLGGGTIMIRS